MHAFEMNIRIELLSELHTSGPGRSLPLLDRCIEVDERGMPVIPSSLLRGRVRAQMERLKKALGEPVCTPPNPERMCPHNAYDQASPTYCAVCKVFGSPWKQSSLYFSDFRLSSPIKTNRRTGIGINRKLNTVEEQRLYVIETVPVQNEGTVFTGVAEGWLSCEDITWLVASMRSLTHLGGGKGRGLGRVNIVVDQVFILNDETGEMNATNVESLLQEIFINA